MFLSKPFPDELEITSRGMYTVKYINSWSSDQWNHGILQSPSLQPCLYSVDGGVKKYSNKLVLSVLFNVFCHCQKAGYRSVSIPPQFLALPKNLNQNPQLRYEIPSFFFSKGWMEMNCASLYKQCFRASCNCFPVFSWLYVQDQIIVV